MCGCESIIIIVVVVVVIIVIVIVVLRNYWGISPFDHLQKVHQ